jgi:hypothetical protein
MDKSDSAGGIYLVTAYRWGLLNQHQYFVYAGLDKAKALALAREETYGVGGKYGCAVYVFDESGTGYTLEAYFPSSYAEEKPHHDESCDMHRRLGIILHNYARGTVYLPDLSCPGILKPVKMEPPEWVVAEVEREEKMAETSAKARDEAREKALYTRLLWLEEANVLVSMQAKETDPSVLAEQQAKVDTLRRAADAGLRNESESVECSGGVFIAELEQEGSE